MGKCICIVNELMILSSEHATIFGGSGGIRSTARPELPYPCYPQAKSRYETFRRGK